MSTKSPLEELKVTFMNYCTFGDRSNPGQLDGRKFAKMAKECKLLDGKCKSTDIDLIFTALKKGARTISFQTFLDALNAVAAKKWPEEHKADARACHQKVIEIVAAHRAPISSGTKAEKVKFHDDKSSYTGVHKAGGPTTQDNRITLSSLTNRHAN